MKNSEITVSKKLLLNFAHGKEVYFDREVGTYFEKLIRQVTLIEQFKRCVSDDIKTSPEKQQVETLQKAIAYADDYMLTQ